MKSVHDNTPEGRIVRAAWDVRAHSHSPYSGFRVGAALWLPDQDEVVCGVNVENASYGATVCAERSAVLQAVSRFGKVPFGMLAVATDAEDPAVPCALCLQVLAEFCLPTMPVLLVNAGGVHSRYVFRDLLPHPFTVF